MHRAEFGSAISPIMTMPYFALILEITPHNHKALGNLLRTIQYRNCIFGHWSICSITYTTNSLYSFKTASEVHGSEIILNESRKAVWLNGKNGENERNGENKEKWENLIHVLYIQYITNFWLFSLFRLFSPFRLFSLYTHTQERYQNLGETPHLYNVLVI